MSDPDPSARLCQLLPWLGAAVIAQALLFAYGVWSEKLPPVWPVLVGDLVFTAAVLFALWRALGRRR